MGSSTNRMHNIDKYALRERVRIFRLHEIVKPITSKVSPINVFFWLIAFLPHKRFASAVEAAISVGIIEGGRQSTWSSA